MRYTSAKIRVFVLETFFSLLSPTSADVCLFGFNWESPPLDTAATLQKNCSMAANSSGRALLFYPSIIISIEKSLVNLIRRIQNKRHFINSLPLIALFQAKVMQKRSWIN